MLGPFTRTTKGAAVFRAANPVQLSKDIAPNVFQDGLIDRIAGQLGPGEVAADFKAHTGHPSFSHMRGDEPLEKGGESS
jgi:hypothetical protein